MTEPTASSIELHPGATEIDHDVVPGSTEWLGYMTGSKVSVVLGISPFTTRLELWRQMTGRAGPQPVSAHMQWGTDREPIIRDATAAELGTTIHTPRMLVSKGDPRFAYSVDGIIDSLRLWECKTATVKSAASWVYGIPEHYAAQWQWGAYVTGLDEGLFTVEIHEDFLPVSTVDYPITRDGKRIEQLIDAMEEFLGFVDSDTPPPPLGAVVITDPDLIELVQRWAKDNAQKLDFEKAIKAARKTIDPLGEDARALMTEDGEVLCHWTGGEDKAVETVDWAAIEAAHPGAAKAATRTYVDHAALAYLVPDAVKAHTTTTTTSTTPSLKMGARK